MNSKPDKELFLETLLKINVSAGVSHSLVLVKSVFIKMSIHNCLANEKPHDLVLGFEMKSFTGLTESNFVANKRSSYIKTMTLLSINT